jgi:hypothetical protein
LRPIALVACLAVVACGSEPTTSPSPQPVPTPAPVPAPPPTPQSITITGTITDTVSKAVIGSWSQDVTSLPASVTVSAPGHITRQTRVGSRTPTVDLIPTAPPFSSIFYGQLVRNLLESSTPDVTWMLPAAPSLYLQTQGLSGSNIEHLISAAREIVPLMTGNRYQLSTVETGAETRPPQAGWIVVDIINDKSDQSCGRALVGAVNGHIWLNVAQSDAGCTFGTDVISQGVMRHEMSHALGFWHIDVPNSLMYYRTNRGAGLPTDLERYHAAIAYTRQPGNADPDNDSPRATPLSVGRPRVILD